MRLINLQRETVQSLKLLIGVIFIGYTMFISLIIFSNPILKLDDFTFNAFKKNLVNSSTDSEDLHSISATAVGNNFIQNDICNQTWFYFSLAFVLGAVWNFKKLLKVGIF